MRHFQGLKEAYPKLLGIAIFDRLDKEIPQTLELNCLQWKQREIENYLCFPETFYAYAEAKAQVEAVGPLFAPGEALRRKKAMEEAIEEITRALESLEKGSPWDPGTKVSDDFLSPLFKAFFKRLGLYNVMDKKSFHELACFVPVEKIDPEIKEKLDEIVNVASAAKPMKEDQ